MRHYSLAISPCPNDTFIFDALVARKISDIPFTLDTHLYDIEQLNAQAFLGKYDIIKVSYGLIPFVLDTYALLRVGSALGKGVGPLLIAKEPISLSQTDKIYSVLSPGKYTTANFLFDLFFSLPIQKSYTVFSEIEEKILSGYADLGIIIHENRFTYAQKGLVKIADLGELWEKKFHLPIPLGGILIKKNIPDLEKIAIKNAIENSLSYAHNNWPHLGRFITDNAQAMEATIMRKHITLYVNHYTKNLDGTAIKAIMALFQEKHTCQFPKDWLV